MLRCYRLSGIDVLTVEFLLSPGTAVASRTYAVMTNSRDVVLTNKGIVLPDQIFDHTFSFPAHSRVGRLNSLCLGSEEESHAHDQ